MKYEFNQELSSLSLSMKTADGEKAVFDRLEFPILPRETIRMDLQKGLKEAALKTENIAADCLLKYNSLEKYEAGLYLVRDCHPDSGLEPFETADPEQSCRALLQILELSKLYHQQGLILGGLSLGQLKQDLNGGFYLQDPLVMNYLSKYLNEEYRVDDPPEVINGNPWVQQSDLFSWGNLAYRLLTGEDPFTAETTEERIDKILKIGAASPKDIKPELSNGLSQLIMDCLSVEPRKRPGLEAIILRLGQLIETGRLTVSSAEALEYREKASQNRRRYQIKERFRLWFRKYGAATLISLGIVLFLGFIWMGSKSKPIITEKDKPAEVLAYYFKGVKTLDVQMVDEALHKAKNSFSDMVTNLYVIDRTRRGMNFYAKDGFKIDLLNLRTELLSQDAAQVKYKASYTFRITLPKEIQYIERVDNYTLEPVHKVWRITRIEVLNEKRWNEKVPEQKDREIPVNSPVPADPKAGK